MPFPFLQLATEIRLPIYRLLLPYSEYHGEEQNSNSPVRWYPGRYHCHSILVVSHQVHKEATEILYRENFFAIYIKHPREPRLPMNGSRADPETFMFVSWARRPNQAKPKMNCAWAHPQNPRIPFSTLRNHQSFHHIQKFHISLPPFDDLSGVDMFMKKTSFAAFNGINAWIEKCARRGGVLEVAEMERMSIVQRFKEPIDQLGILIQSSQRIDQLCISVQVPWFQITFSEFLLEELLRINVSGAATCYFISSMRTLSRNLNEFQLEFQLRRWEDILHLTPKSPRQQSQLPPKMASMCRLLQAIRTFQQLDPALIPQWLSPMPA